MKFRIIWVGKTRDQNWLRLQNEYLSRLRRFASVEVVELRDGEGPNAVESEGDRILAAVRKGDFVALLDPAGRSLSSTELACLVEDWQNQSIKQISLVLGGPQGIAGWVAECADIKLSLSFLTFTHEMARVILLEQLYRAFTIIKGFPYQK